MKSQTMHVRVLLAATALFATAMLLACGTDGNDDASGNGNGNGNGDAVTFPESRAVEAGYQFEWRYDQEREMEIEVVAEDGEVVHSQDLDFEQRLHFTFVVQDVDDGGRITGLQVEVHEHRSTSPMGPESEQSPTVGNTYLATRSGNDWQVTRDGEPVTGIEAEHLGPYLDQSVAEHIAETLAGKTLAPGARVEFDPEILFAEMVQEEWGVEFSAVFQGLETIAGRPTARFAMSLSMSLDEENSTIATTFEGDMYVDVATFTEVKAEATGTMSMRETAPHGTQQGDGTMRVSTATEIRPAAD